MEQITDLLDSCHFCVAQRFEFLHKAQVITHHIYETKRTVPLTPGLRELTKDVILTDYYTS